MIASPSTVWHVIFSPGAYTYTNNRWLWGIQNVIIDAYHATFQNTSSDANYGNSIPLMVNDPFDDSGDVPAVAFGDGVYRRGVLRERREVLPGKLLRHELLWAGCELLPWGLLRT